MKISIDITTKEIKDLKTSIVKIFEKASVQAYNDGYKSGAGDMEALCSEKGQEECGI